MGDITGDSRGTAKPIAAIKGVETLFKIVAFVCLLFALLSLVSLIASLLIDGLPRLSWDFLTQLPSRRASRAGIGTALVGSIYLILLTACISLPVSIGAAVYLEEYGTSNRFAKFIELNIANLAGVPSIIYGILGLQLFVRALSFDRSLLAGAATMSLLVMPIIIISAREAIHRVPTELREAAFALGATRWEVIRDIVIPSALPGIATGSILAFSRAIGETAPLIAIGALTYVAFYPDSIFSPFTALPIQAFNWISRPQTAFHQNAAAGILVLLVILFSMNSLAIYLRHRYKNER